METIPVSAESFKVGLIGAGKMAEIIDREESFIEFWISRLYHFAPTSLVRFWPVSS
ncbi:unnamed protein product [Brassica oleracea]